MFKKTPNQRINGSTGVSLPVEHAISIIGPGMRIVGEVFTEGAVRVEGTIEGTLRAAKAVVIGKTGEVIGDIFTREAVIGGRIAGSVSAESRLELQSSCVIDGEIKARAQHLQLAEGARFSGSIHMIDKEEAPLRALPAETPDIPKHEVSPQRKTGT